MRGKILVIGGGGYIGSHMVLKLLERGDEVITFDDFSTGYRDSILGGSIIKGCLSDALLLDQVFSNNKIDSVIHFASFIQVGESVQNPAKYYSNNLVNTLNLLNVMVKYNVMNFVFSSTAAIFGEPKYVPINEAHPVLPINPYGASKAMVEQVLKDYDNAYGLKSVCLRYFNACGADPDCRLGERHEPETHLIPLALQSVSGRRKSLTVFGRDYDTPDGTCIRDYVHIGDLCDAHLLALGWLSKNKSSAAFNLGNGNGFSVADVLAAVEKVTGQKVPVVEGVRRLGDPARLISDSSKARKHLNWHPIFSDLETIVSHAWQWEKHIVQTVYQNAHSAL